MFNLPEIIKLIDALTISTEAKDGINTQMNVLKKNIDILLHKYERVKRDKNVVREVLNNTIKQLEENKVLVEQQVEELNISYSGLKNAYAELEKFSYIVSHDLKSPLRNIAGFTELLERNKFIKSDEQSSEYMNYIVTGVNQMAITIDDLLSYAKVTNESQNIQRSLVNFNEILDKVKLRLKNLIERENVTIEVLDVLPEIYVAESAIIQLFQNLIGNAIKFKKDEEAPIIKIMAQETLPNLWEFIVSDNGRGMNNEFQKNAFKAFQREQSTNIPGTGLGLAICKKVVQMHFGDIFLVSKLGKGTAFTFTINSIH